MAEEKIENLPKLGEYKCNPEDFDGYYKNKEVTATEPVNADGCLVDPPEVETSGVENLFTKGKSKEQNYWESIKSKLINNDTRLILGVGKALDDTSLPRSAKQQAEDQTIVRDTVNLVGKMTAEQANLKEVIEQQKKKIAEVRATTTNWEKFVSSGTGSKLQNFKNRFDQASLVGSTTAPFSNEFKDASVKQLIKTNNLRLKDLADGLEATGDTVVMGIDAVAAFGQNAGSADFARQCREFRDNLNEAYEGFKKTQKEVLGPVMNQIDDWQNFKNRLEQGMSVTDFANSLSNLDKKFGKNSPLGALAAATKAFQDNINKLMQLEAEIAQVMDTITRMIEALSIIVLSICELIPAVQQMIEFFKRLLPFIGQLALLMLAEALIPSDFNLTMPRVTFKSATSWRGLGTALGGLGESFTKCGKSLTQIADVANKVSSATDSVSKAVLESGTWAENGLNKVLQDGLKFIVDQVKGIGKDSKLPIPSTEFNPLALARASVPSMVDDSAPRPSVTPDIMGILGRLLGAASSFAFNFNKFTPGVSEVDKFDLVKRIQNGGAAPGAPAKRLVGADSFKHIDNQQKVIAEAVKIIQTNASATESIVAAARAMQKIGYDATEEDSKDALEKILEASQTMSAMQNAILNDDLEEASMTPIARDFYRCKAEDEEKLHSDATNHPSPNDRLNSTKIKEKLDSKLSEIVKAGPGLPNSFAQISDKLRNKTAGQPSKTLAEVIAGLPALGVSSSYYTPEYLTKLNSFISDRSTPNTYNLNELKYLPFYLIAKSSATGSSSVKDGGIASFQLISGMIEFFLEKPQASIYIELANMSVGNDPYGYVGRGLVALQATKAQFLSMPANKPNPGQVLKNIQDLKTANSVWSIGYFALESFLKHDNYDIRAFVEWLNQAQSVDRNLSMPADPRNTQSPYVIAAIESEQFWFDNKAILGQLGSLIMILRKSADAEGGPMGYEYFVTMSIHMLINEIRKELKKNLSEVSLAKIAHLKEAAKFLAGRLAYGQPMLKTIESLDGVEG